MTIRFFSSRMIQCAVGFIAAITLLASACAHEFKIGDIQIVHPYARATAPQQAAGGAYLGLENRGKTDDRLIRVESGIAHSVEMHTMEMNGDIMKMREVDGIDLQAGARINMQPGGGVHIMLMGLKQPLKAGATFPLTLYFEKAGKIDVIVNVEAAGASH